MKVLFVAAEGAPFFKTGGLGDVAYALPKELRKQGVDIRVVLPYYTQMPERFKEQLTEITHFRVELGYKSAYVGVKTLTLDGVQYYFIDNLAYFDRDQLYSQNDDGERFGFFDIAVVEMMEQVDFIPDIIHVNDWQTAMIPALLVDRYHWVDSYRNIRKVLTIHNIRFQGWQNESVLKDIFNTTYALYHENGVKKEGQVNYLKGGINFSDKVTTVSPNYAREIQTPEFGEKLDGELRYNAWKLSGIINGIDYEQNNPETDPNLVENYDASTVQTGKAANKRALQERVGLSVDPDVALLGVVTRLTDQKGMQLLQEKAEYLLTNFNIQIVVLGTGDEAFENSFRYFEWKYPGEFCAYIDFDVELAQQIYAGSDMFLMPSAFEPCGLSQMIAMRYGTLPIVHETGGLSDTVKPYNQYTGEGNGFSFNIFTGDVFAHIIQYALDIYENQPDVWFQLIYQAMATDFRWTEPAKDYIRLYEDLL
ncbi:glycogen synthase GlgA [Aerococcus sp. L_32]|uniref:glycogen synthase GlgA n=1 Tax=Aerococcus sp. L_32 TaxID=3422316 RepID=UPI003D6A4695